MSWKVRGVKQIYENQFMKLEEDAITTAYGDEVLYSIVRKKPCALVIPWNGERFILEKLYRFSIREYSWEFPCGHFQGSSVEETAINELKEEAGITAKKIKKIGVFHPANGFLDQECHAFLATELSYGQMSRDKSEKGMIIKKFTADEVEKMILDGKIRDGLTISAYTLLKLNKKLELADR